MALVTLLGAASAFASPRTVLQGSFDLPEQAYWGGAVLPAGEYTFTVDREASGQSLINLRGQSFSATVIAVVTGEETAGRNCLKLEDVNGAYVVRELDSNGLGTSLRFAISKAALRAGEGPTARRVTTVPLTAAGY